MATNAEMGRQDLQSQVIAVNNCIDKLICETRTPYWRTALLDMIKPHFQHEPVRQLLQYLLGNPISLKWDKLKLLQIFSAMNACLRGPDTPVPIDISVPANFDLVNWRRILIGVTLTLCEPDTNRDIRLIGVTISSSTKLQYLKGFYFVVQGLIDLSWDVLQLVINLQEKDASLLYETLNDTINGYNIPEFSRVYITHMYQQKMQVMRQLGFYRVSADSPITWTKPRHSNEIQPLLYVLHGIFRIPVGVSASD